MAYAHSTDLAHSRPSRLTALFAEVGAFFTVFGAAVRISRAVEDNRQPDARDLKIIGVKEPLEGLR